MLVFVHLFGKHFGFHLHGDYVLVVTNQVADADKSGKCNLCRKRVQISVFDAAYTQKPKFHSELQPRKPKSLSMVFT
jgi:hypothetical protein